MIDVGLMFQTFHFFWLPEIDTIQIEDSTEVDINWFCFCLSTAWAST